MDELSGQEIRDLGEAFGIPVGDGEVDYLADQVNGNLDHLDEVYDFDVGGAEYGKRSWSPGDDDYNAIATECEVPATGHGAVDGLTVGVKDIIAVAGVPMECGSATMQGFVPQFDAAVTERLLDEGASIAAKTNLDEFAGGGRGVSFEGQIVNPHDPERSPGGSSGGSAVAVAVGAVDVALGTDTGGSIRNPASKCGIVGLKPTDGLVPLHGVVENTHTLDHVGPMTRSVEDAAAVLEAIAGKDRRDPASMAAAGRDDYSVGGYVDATLDPPDLADVSLGLVQESLGEGDAEEPVEDSVVDRTEAAVEALSDAGATVERVPIPGYEYATPIKDTLSCVELVAHWRAGGAAYRRNVAVDEGYQQALAHRLASAGNEVNPYYRARMLAGAHIVTNHASRHYTRAQAARRAYAEEFDAALGGVDALLLPTEPMLPPGLEEAKRPGWSYGRNTKPANVTGLPAITLPNGSVDGLPVGLTLMGRRFLEDDLLGVAATVDGTVDGHVPVPG